MRIFLAKFNWWHIVIILVFPVGLAIINPNWIFNVNITDDYIYLGYQLDLPKYATWSPSIDYYFIERLSWIFPTYLIRQIFSPLMSNFLIHLGVYYIAIFSIYSIISRLFYTRLALFICLLLGQFSLLLRATGWDYIDGYTLALFALCISLLTYATTYPRDSSHTYHNKYTKWYLIGAGYTFLWMINVQVFSILYFPAIAGYTLILNHYHRRKHISNFVVWGGLGSLIGFGILSLIYYSLVGKWFIFRNTLRIIEESVLDRNWQNFINGYIGIQDNYIFQVFFVVLGILGIWFFIFHRYNAQSKSKNYYHHLSAITLFGGSLGVFAIWILRGYVGYFFLTFYLSLLLPSAFLLIASIIAYRATDIHTNIIGFVFWGGLLSFALFNYVLATSPHEVLIVLLCATIVCLLGFLFMKSPANLLMFSVFVTLIGFLGGIHIQTISVYNPDRILNQSVYEAVIKASNHIRERYDDYRLEEFRVWFNLYNTKEEFLKNHAIAGLYLYSWGRIITPFDITNPLFDSQVQMTREIILLSHPETHEQFLANTVSLLQQNQLNLYVQETIMLSDALSMSFSIVYFSGIQNTDTIFYDFNSLAYKDRGFDNVEYAGTRTYRWTKDTIASLTFIIESDDFNPNQLYQVQLWALASLEAEVLDSLAVTINGVQLQLERIPQGADTLFQAQIDGQTLVGDVLELTFTTNRISRPADFGYADPRTLGVALDWLTITPLNP